MYSRVPAAIPRFRATAQAVKQVLQRNIPRGNMKYLVSFIGFAPVDDPAVVIYVVVDEPNVEDQANSTYPQYIAQGILSELLPYLNVKPDEIRGRHSTGDRTMGRLSGPSEKYYRHRSG